MYENRNYLIIPVSELNKVDFNTVLETSAETVRKSVDGTKTFIKWDDSVNDTPPPEFVENILNAEGPYTHSEILDILSTPEWTKPMENI